MIDYLFIFITTVFVNNIILVKFLGLCPFFGVSQKLETSINMSLATTFVLTLSSMAAYLVETYLLIPLELTFLRTISFIVVIAAIVQFTEMFIKKNSPLLYRVLGIFLPLITTNCAVLGVALLNLTEQHNLMESAIYGISVGVGFSMVLILFSAVRVRIEAADIPDVFRGSAIAMITAGIMSMAFMGFGGIGSE